MHFVCSSVWMLAYAVEICYDHIMGKSVKKSKFILIILIFSIFSVILTGCSSKYEYAPASGRIEIYNSVDEDSAWIDCSEYSTEHADYFFETTLKDKQKDTFVDTAEQILNDYPTDKIKFVVGTSFNTAYVGEVHNATNTVCKSIDTFYFNINFSISTGCTFSFVLFFQNRVSLFNTVLLAGRVLTSWTRLASNPSLPPECWD